MQASFLVPPVPAVIPQFIQATMQASSLVPPAPGVIHQFPQAAPMLSLSFCDPAVHSGSSHADVSNGASSTCCDTAVHSGHSASSDHGITEHEVTRLQKNHHRTVQVRTATYHLSSTQCDLNICKMYYIIVLLPYSLVSSLYSAK